MISEKPHRAFVRRLSTARSSREGIRRSLRSPSTSSRFGCCHERPQFL